MNCREELLMGASNMKDGEQPLAIMTASNLAKYIIHKANSMNVSITHLKLQKILYYVAGVFAGALNVRVFWDSIEAWGYGPVIRNVYIEYCSWGALPLICEEEVSLDYDDEQRKLVDFVINQKIRMTGRELVNATCSESPWKKYADCIAIKPEISYQDLRDYFINSNEVQQWNSRM